MAEEPAGVENQNTDTDWRQGLPEDIRDAPVFKDIADLPTLAKNYQELKSYQGNSLRIPGEDAGEEDVAAFHQKIMDKVPGLIYSPDLENSEQMDAIYTRLGRPEEATGYEIPEIDTGGIEMDFTMAEALKPIAHKYGLSKKQFEGIVSEMTAGNVGQAKQLQQQHAQDISDLSREWGAAYNERVSKAAKVAEATNAPAELVNAIKNGHAGSGTLKWLYGLSESLGGETAQLVKQQGSPTMTPDDAKMKISEIRNNKEHPYWNQADPAHASAKKRMRELHKLAYPGDAGTQGISVGTGGLAYQ